MTAELGVRKFSSLRAARANTCRPPQTGRFCFQSACGKRPDSTCRSCSVSHIGTGSIVSVNMRQDSSARLHVCPTHMLPLMSLTPMEHLLFVSVPKNVIHAELISKMSFWQMGVRRIKRRKSLSPWLPRGSRTACMSKAQFDGYACVMYANGASAHSYASCQT